MDLNRTPLKESDVIKFNAHELQYQDCEIKSSQKGGNTVKYEVLRFIDFHTKREIYIYNWSGSWLGEDPLKAGQRCELRGYVNSVGRSNWLILTDIGVLIDNKVCDPYKGTEGFCQIEPSPY